MALSAETPCTPSPLGGGLEPAMTPNPSWKKIEPNPLSVNILGPIDGAGAVRPGRGGFPQGLILPEAEPRAFLPLLVPEITALGDAMAHAGDGADDFIDIIHKLILYYFVFLYCALHKEVEYSQRLMMILLLSKG
jgi:hypothetical protein